MSGFKGYLGKYEIMLKDVLVYTSLWHGFKGYFDKYEIIGIIFKGILVNTRLWVMVLTFKGYFYSNEAMGIVFRDILVNARLF